MAFFDQLEYDEDILKGLTDWTVLVHNEIQESGSVRYDIPAIEPLNGDYRKEIGDYLHQTLGMDYSSVMNVLNGTEAVYHVDSDVLLVSYDVLNSEDQFQNQSLVAHEQGHRLGQKIIEKRLQPLSENQNVNQENVETLKDYLKSENFAERTKTAVGKNLRQNFQYNEKLIDNPPAIYEVRNRIGPDSLINSDREETIEEMVQDIEKLLREVHTDNPSWG